MRGPNKAELQAIVNDYKRLYEESEREVESLRCRVKELEEDLSMKNEHLQELNQQLTAVDLFCNLSNMITDQEIVEMAVSINDRVDKVATLIANCSDFSYSKLQREPDSRDIPTSIIYPLGQDTIAILQNLDGRNQVNRFLQIALQSCIIRDLVHRVDNWCHDLAVYGQLRDAYFNLWGKGNPTIAKSWWALTRAAMSRQNSPRLRDSQPLIATISGVLHASGVRVGHAEAEILRVRFEPMLLGIIESMLELDNATTERLKSKGIEFECPTQRQAFTAETMDDYLIGMREVVPLEMGCVFEPVSFGMKQVTTHGSKVLLKSKVYRYGSFQEEMDAVIKKLSSGVGR
ncbi:hypothetical protein VNI00_009474 [Paramarasmius palmivorus]|uniref:Uncharacterized protein n=1 Tax=Paramarasmius palmivorus TaxID=297713 RepID=A0AAW0CQA5_9AGAR